MNISSGLTNFKCPTDVHPTIISQFAITDDPGNCDHGNEVRTSTRNISLQQW